MESKFIVYKDKEIHILDISNLELDKDSDLADELMEKSGSEIRARPLKSVLSLFCVENAGYSVKLVKDLKELAKKDEPYVIKTGVVGVVGLNRIIFNAVNTFSRRDAKTFETKEQAMEWLIREI